jgi:hypothetical protein
LDSEPILEKKRFYIKQAVTLTGLSTAAFDRASSVCEEIYRKMSNSFPDGQINHWQNAAYEGHLATNFTARYFTSRKDAKHEANLSFLEGVDPDGVLEALRRHDLIHGPDNQVTFLGQDEQPAGCV